MVTKYRLLLQMDVSSTPDPDWQTVTGRIFETDHTEEYIDRYIRELESKLARLFLVWQIYYFRPADILFSRRSIMAWKKQYGYAHKKARVLALANLVDGTPCWRCHRPMYRRQRLHLDHVVPVVNGGAGGPTRLAHAYCNVAAGNSQRVRKGKRSSRPIRRLPKW